MNGKEARLFLQNNLTRSKSSRYLEWVATNYDTRLQGHHILGKMCDYLIVKITPKVHIMDPYKNFIEYYYSALEVLGVYIRSLGGHFEGSMYYALDSNTVIDDLKSLFKYVNKLEEDQNVFQESKASSTSEFI